MKTLYAPLLLLFIFSWTIAGQTPPDKKDTSQKIILQLKSPEVKDNPRKSLQSRLQTVNNAPPAFSGDPAVFNRLPFQDPASEDVSFINACPVLLTDGTLIVLWSNEEQSGFFCTTSENDGRSWSTPWIACNDTYVIDNLSAVCLPSGRIVVAWRSWWEAISISYSDNNGLSWSTPNDIGIMDGTENITLSQTKGGKLWLAYSVFGDGDGSFRILHLTSLDGGTTWNAPPPHGYLSMPGTAYSSAFVSKNDSTVMVYYDAGQGIVRRASTDDGATWADPDTLNLSSQRLERIRIVQTNDSTWWLIAQTSARVLRRYRQWDVVWFKTTDGGNTWSDLQHLTNYVGNDRYPSAAILNGSPFITFASTRWMELGDQYRLWYALLGTSVENAPPEIYEIGVDELSLDSAHVTVLAVDEKPLSDVKAFSIVNGAVVDSTLLLDDGEHGDTDAGDQNYGGSMGPFKNGDRLDLGIRVTDTDGNSVTQSFMLCQFPQIHTAGNITLNIYANSMIGNAAGASTWPKEGGYRYIYNGGLWVGCLSEDNPIVSYTDNWDSDWSGTPGTLFTLGPGISDQEGDVTYDDSLSSSQYNTPTGFRVNQRTYQWSDTSRNDFIIFKYTMTNTGRNGPARNAYAGFWIDPDIAAETDPSRNMVGYDSLRHMVYAYNTEQNPGTYIGVRLLGSGSEPSTIFGTRSSLYMLEYDSDSSLYALMSRGSVTLPDSAGDVRMLITTAPFVLDPGDSKETAFGLVFGDGLADLQKNSDTMAAIANSMILTGIDQRRTSESLPRQYRLDQNYPNPFNPSTTIEFSLPAKSHVTLKIYDLLGRQITTLVDENLHAGSYTRAWDARSMPSGVYFMKLNAGRFSTTKKLMFVK